jgi:RNA polymerase sigma factor (sigma-70 family)
MTTSRGGGPVRSIQALYDAGTLSGLEDGDLLARFLDGGDGAEAAFEALVARHGAMVLRVCRSVAGPDADDAFQATFLVLACRAASVRRRGSLGPWLFGVARRVSACARQNAARRRAHERLAVEGSPTAYEPPGPDDDLAILMDELARLPARDRDPLILCHLQGLSYQAAAERLRCPLGTLSVRLHRAKQRLRARLERRGVTDSARSIAPIPPPLVPLALSTATARLATLAGSALGGGVPISVLTLTQGALRAMRISKAIGASVAFLALAAGAWAWNASAADDDAAPAREAAGTQSLRKYRLTGRVADPDTGEPIAGATIKTYTSEVGKSEVAERSARSGPDGFYSMELASGHHSMTTIEPAPGCYVVKPGLSFRPFALSEAVQVERQDVPMRRGASWEFRLAWARDGRPAEHARVYNELVSANAYAYADADADADGVARIGLPRDGGQIDGKIEPPGRWDVRPLGFSLRRDDGFRPEAVRSVVRIEGSDRYRLMDAEGRSAEFESKEGGRIEPRLEAGRLAIHVALPESEPGVLAAVGGKVVDRSGAPVPGALVEVAYVWKNAEGHSTAMKDSESCRTTTDGSGRYRFECIPDAVSGAVPTSLQIGVRKEGFADADTEPLDIERGKPATFPDIVLVPAYSVVGVVIGPDGNPVEGAQIQNVSRRMPRMQVVRTDAAGRFRFDGLPEGRATLYVQFGELARYYSQAVPVPREQEPVTIQLVPQRQSDGPAAAPGTGMSKST